MTPNTDAVARILADAEDVDLPASLTGAAPPPQDGDPGPDAEDAGYDRDPDLGEGQELPHAGDGMPPLDDLRRAAAFPINDLGNGLRFVLHFGQDVMHVPRVGWHVWDGRVWQIDPDMIATRKRAQRLSDLVLAEVPFITLSAEKMRLLETEAALIAERDAIGLTLSLIHI